MTETENVLALAAADYRVHLQLIAQLQVALDTRSAQIKQLKTENEALKQSLAKQKGGNKK